MHSTVSDGSLSVPELVQAVARSGVSLFSLTDHDTLDGQAEAAELARAHGLRFLNGVEISTRFEHMELHILGYGFDLENQTLLELLTRQKEARHGRIPVMVERLRGLGIELTVDDVYRAAGGGNPGRPHVAKALVAAGAVKDVDEAFKRYLGDGGPAQIRKSVPEPRTAIAALHAAGGKAVWAHALARPIHRAGGFALLLRELAAAGLDGVEEVHPAHDPAQRKRIRKEARELGLSLTGGSDFHGQPTPGVSIGRGRGHDAVPISVVDALFA
jgi:predicted metal-dependent phosphoesterase TrpH